jgi:hypothetical protein
MKCRLVVKVCKYDQKYLKNILITRKLICECIFMQVPSCLRQLFGEFHSQYFHLRPITTDRMFNTYASKMKQCNILQAVDFC